MLKWLFVGLGLVFLIGIFGVVMVVLRGLLVFFVVITALVLLIAAGNYLNSVLGIKYKAQQFNEPRREQDERDGEQ